MDVRRGRARTEQGGNGKGEGQERVEMGAEKEGWARASVDGWAYADGMFLLFIESNLRHGIVYYYQHHHQYHHIFCVIHLCLFNLFIPSLLISFRPLASRA